MPSFTAEDFKKKLADRLASAQPYLGHPMLPIPLLPQSARTIKVGSYVELELARFLEEYTGRYGGRSTSETVRRLIIIGAMAEGYIFDESEQPK
jgi:hypothetical protein